MPLQANHGIPSSVPFVQLSGWNPDYKVFGHIGNDSPLHILHQATTSFPVPANTITNVGPFTPFGLTTYIWISGVFGSPVPTDINIVLQAATTVSSVVLASIDYQQNGNTVRITSPNFSLSTRSFAINSTTGDFFIYLGIRIALLENTTLQIESSTDLTINNHYLYSSTRLPSRAALAQQIPPLPFTPISAC